MKKAEEVPHYRTPDYHMLLAAPGGSTGTVESMRMDDEPEGVTDEHN